MSLRVFIPCREEKVCRDRKQAWTGAAAAYNHDHTPVGNKHEQYPYLPN